MSAAQLVASIRRHSRFLCIRERAMFAPSSSEQAVREIALRMGARMPGSTS